MSWKNSIYAKIPLALKEFIQAGKILFFRSVVVLSKMKTKYFRNERRRKTYAFASESQPERKNENEQNHNENNQSQPQKIRIVRLVRG